MITLHAITVDCDNRKTVIYGDVVKGQLMTANINSRNIVCRVQSQRSHDGHEDDNTLRLFGTFPILGFRK